jgi:hypothetical protein
VVQRLGIGEVRLRSLLSSGPPLTAGDAVRHVLFFSSPFTGLVAVTPHVGRSTRA